MPHAPQTGISSTITLGGTVMVIQDHSITMSREVIKSTPLSSVYEQSIAGRISATISCNIIVDTTATNSIMEGFQNQTLLGTAVTFSIADDGGFNVYAGNALVVSAQHTMSADSIDIIAVELQVTGQIT